jgi:hypothetical protein
LPDRSNLSIFYGNNVSYRSTRSNSTYSHWTYSDFYYLIPIFYFYISGNSIVVISSSASDCSDKTFTIIFSQFYSLWTLSTLEGNPLHSGFSLFGNYSIHYKKLWYFDPSGTVNDSRPSPAINNLCVGLKLYSVKNYSTNDYNILLSYSLSIFPPYKF